MKKVLLAVTATAIFSIAAFPAFAHVVVKPAEVGVAAFQTFTVGVPNEKDVPVTSLRLVIPEGVGSVSPNVKPGWTIEKKGEGEGDSAKVTEIDWAGGSIPPGQRDDFLFSAQVPANETTLSWKAYQTYQDGTVVSWDQDPNSMKNLSDAQKEENEQKGLGPLSQTKIVNDLASDKSTTQSSTSNGTNQTLPLTVSALALLAALFSLWLQLQKRK